MLHSAYYHPSIDFVQRKSKHKRFTASKLSSETIQTLPEYSSPPGWGSTCTPLPFLESDRPPDYPETADGADGNTERDHKEHVAHIQHHPLCPLPRRAPTHGSRPTQDHAATCDPFIDTLLERSVNALEMSNALLRTTISTQSSLSALLSSESESDHFLEVRARNLSTRIRVSGGVHETWMEHLEEISEGVDKLFEEEGINCLDEQPAVSRSLPTTTIPDLRHRRKPSILELDGSPNSHLRYSHPTRDALVAPAPRALTQYVESITDPCLITLPSTLGLRVLGSSHSIQSGESLCAHDRETRSALPGESPRSQLESDTPAYQLLSELVKRSESLTPPRISRFRDKCASVGPTGTGRGARSSFSPTSTRSLLASQDHGRPASQAKISKHRSEPTRITSISSLSLHAMPTDEELSSSSSESLDYPTGYRTVESLRRILNDHPSSISIDTLRRRAPAFLPITPPPVPVQGISTATASISRLYTKGRHSLSTRPPSPPAHSSLKVQSVPPTPSPSPSTMSLSEAFGIRVARVIGSGSASRVPTPKRISFAELPDSYTGLRPGTSKLRERKGKKRNRQGKGDDREEVADWLKTLLHGLPLMGMVGLGSREERMARGWGNRPGYGTLDDWAV